MAAVCNSYFGGGSIQLHLFLHLSQGCVYLWKYSKSYNLFFFFFFFFFFGFQPPPPSAPKFQLRSYVAQVNSLARCRLDFVMLISYSAFNSHSIILTKPRVETEKEHYLFIRNKHRTNFAESEMTRHSAMLNLTN
jgi:hypothetical protein